MRDTFNALPFPKDREIAWLLNQGISDAAMLSPSPIKEARVVFDDHLTFDFDDSGEPALIFRAEDRHETIDLVAWSARSGRLASWRGVAFAIGDVAEIWNPAHYLFDGALPVYSSPLAWLQADRRGVVIIEPRDAYGYFRSCPRVRVSDHVFGQRLERWIQPPRPCVEILVEVPAEKEAA